MKIISIGNRISNFRARIDKKFSLPERFKGTIVERWTNYWHGLITDYAGVARDVFNNVQTNPRKALKISAVTYGLYKCAEHNPDEGRFIEQLRDYQGQMSLVANDLHNPVSREYLTYMEKAINQRKLRMLSLGICTLLWVDLYSEDDCTYPAVCDYTGVSYWNFHQRIVDIGFWKRFWHLQWKMRNYDINYLD